MTRKVQLVQVPVTCTASDGYVHTASSLSSQCAKVLGLISEYEHVATSTPPNVDYTIPEAAVWVKELRARDCKRQIPILTTVEFRGANRRNVAIYSFGTPECSRFGFINGSEDVQLRGLEIYQDEGACDDGN